MVELLLDNGARQSQTIMGNFPVDIAGFCSRSEVVMTFCKRLEKKIEDEIAKQRGGGTDDKGGLMNLLLEDIEQDEVANTNQVMPMKAVSGVDQAKLLS